MNCCKFTFVNLLGQFNLKAPFNQVLVYQMRFGVKWEQKPKIFPYAREKTYNKIGIDINVVTITVLKKKCFHGV